MNTACHDTNVSTADSQKKLSGSREAAPGEGEDLIRRQEASGAALRTLRTPSGDHLQARR